MSKIIPFASMQALLVALGGFLGWFLGGFDGFLYALIAFVALDYISGVMRAIFEKKLSSELGFKGISKKIMIFAMVGIAQIIDAHLMSDSAVLRTAVIFFYCSNEGISLLENVSAIGLPIPQKLKNIIVQFRGKEEKIDESKQTNSD